MSKVKVNLSLDADTADRLKQYAWENHTTVSGAVTTWIWAQKVKNGQVRGQLDIEEGRR